MNIKNFITRKIMMNLKKLPLFIFMFIFLSGTYGTIVADHQPLNDLQKAYLSALFPADKKITEQDLEILIQQIGKDIPTTQEGLVALLLENSDPTKEVIDGIKAKFGGKLPTPKELNKFIMKTMEQISSSASKGNRTPQEDSEFLSEITRATQPQEPSSNINLEAERQATAIFFALLQLDEEVKSRQLASSEGQKGQEKYPNDFLNLAGEKGLNVGIDLILSQQTGITKQIQQLCAIMTLKDEIKKYKLFLEDNKDEASSKIVAEKLQALEKDLQKLSSRKACYANHSSSDDHGLISLQTLSKLFVGPISQGNTVTYSVKASETTPNTIEINWYADEVAATENRNRMKFHNNFVHTLEQTEEHSTRVETRPIHSQCHGACSYTFGYGPLVECTKRGKIELSHKRALQLLKTYKEAEAKSLNHGDSLKIAEALSLRIKRQTEMKMLEEAAYNNAEAQIAALEKEQLETTNIYFDK